MKNLVLLLMILYTVGLEAQSVENVRAEQVGKTVMITYDLVGFEGEVSVEVLCSTDGGRSYGRTLKRVSGDIGEGISSGYGKRIIWEVLEEQKELSGDGIVFKVVAKTSDDNLVFVKGGWYEMGSEDGGSDEKPVHKVYVSDFYMGKYEVTVAEFAEFIEASSYQTTAEKKGYSYCYDGSWDKKDGVTWRDDALGKRRLESDYNHPVIHVSWYDAVAFCEWKSKETGEEYRLPSEAEWEYAARSGGQNHKYSWGNGAISGNIVDETAKKTYNYWTVADGYSDGYVYTAPIGSFKPNELGLYDMSGNVWEWCQDEYESDFYKKSKGMENPCNKCDSANENLRVVRGGSWHFKPDNCRSSYRLRNNPVRSNLNYGFRYLRVSYP